MDRENNQMISPVTVIKKQINNTQKRTTNVGKRTRRVSRRFKKTNGFHKGITVIKNFV